MALMKLLDGSWKGNQWELTPTYNPLYSFSGTAVTSTTAEVAATTDICFPRVLEAGLWESRCGQGCPSEASLPVLQMAVFKSQQYLLSTLGTASVPYWDANPHEAVKAETVLIGGCYALCWVSVLSWVLCPELGAVSCSGCLAMYLGLCPVPSTLFCARYFVLSWVLCPFWVPCPQLDA